jgi:hypothetical protein
MEEKALKQNGLVREIKIVLTELLGEDQIRKSACLVVSYEDCSESNLHLSLETNVGVGEGSWM